ncbi:MAG: hypothetical protein Q7U37_08815 [Gallionella sp.]|nr:hypothetical protein [Gallionella sp.]
MQEEGFQADRHDQHGDESQKKDLSPNTVLIFRQTHCGFVPDGESRLGDVTAHAGKFRAMRPSELLPVFRSGAAKKTVKIPGLMPCDFATASISSSFMTFTPEKIAAPLNGGLTIPPRCHANYSSAAIMHRSILSSPSGDADLFLGNTYVQ